MDKNKGFMNHQGCVADCCLSEKSNYPVESSGSGLPDKLKKSRSTVSNGSIKKVEARKAMSLETAQMEVQHQHKTLSRQVAIRAQSYEVDNRASEKMEGTGTQSSFIKHNKTFHKLFPHIPEGEDLIHAYICALQKEVPYHGRLYVTNAHACFYSSVLLKDTKVVVPVSCIHIVKKQNTALLVPNALSIRTTGGEKYLFVALRNRESCFQLLRSVCPQLEDSSTNSSPVFSSTEASFDKSKLVNSSQSSLNDSLDHFDVSESQSLMDQPLHRPCRETVPNGNVSTVKSLHIEQTDSSSTEELSESGGSWVWNVTEKARTMLVQREANTLNTLLFIYLILVVLLLLSSGYIGLRIVALEEQLTSLGALPEFSLRSGYRQDT